MLERAQRLDLSKSLPVLFFSEKAAGNPWDPWRCRGHFDHGKDILTG